MIRWNFVTAVAIGIWVGMWLCSLPMFRVTAQSAPEAWTLAIGKMTATETESIECYFQVAAGAVLMLHPDGEPCILARGLIGRTGRLVFMVDPAR